MLPSQGYTRNPDKPTENKGATPVLLLLESAANGTLRGALGGAILIAGLRKTGSPASFRRTVRKYALIPAPLIWWVACVVIATEVISGFALLVGFAPTQMALAIAGMLALFTLAVILNLFRGRTFDCGCSLSARGQSISWSLVFRNLGLICACGLVVVSNPAISRVGWIFQASYSVAAFACTQMLLTWRELYGRTPYKVSGALREYRLSQSRRLLQLVPADQSEDRKVSTLTSA